MDKEILKGKKEVLPKIDSNKEIVIYPVKIHKTLIKHKEQLKITSQMDKRMDCCSKCCQDFRQTQLLMEIILLKIDNNSNNRNSNNRDLAK